jgi:uncharacterized flavoprotein (TIGR03862 family)
MKHRPVIRIIGGGPAGLIAADILAVHCDVHVHEQGRQVGRKFLVAGEGGLNITNAAEGDSLAGWYTPADRMRPLLEAFGPEALRAWLLDLGVPTFVGTSGRVFPERGIKPAQVLQAIKRRLADRGVRIHTRHAFTVFDERGRPVVEGEGHRGPLEADATLFALGGASWPVTGSTGSWVAPFREFGIRVNELRPSNCGVELPMTDALVTHAGKPLKNIDVRSGPIRVRGEATITAHGLEGNAIYPVVPAVRAAMAAGEEPTLELDLKPDVAQEELERRLAGAAWKERMAALKLDRPQVALLKAFTPQHRFMDGAHLAHDVKHLRIPVSGLRPIAEAISTAGGIAWDELDDELSLKHHPHLFVAGEMIDWDAPTGGFLLQGCFTTGHAAAMGILRRVVQ